MKAKFRNYTNQMRFTEDYMKVWDFLVRINSTIPVTPNYLWGRWEWGFSHSYFDETQIAKIGLWEDGGQVVALATYESQLGEAFILFDPAYSTLKQEVLDYALDNLTKDGKVKVMIPDGDRDLQKLARARNLRPTQEKQVTAVIEITDQITYELPEGFKIVSLKDEYNLRKFDNALYKGFNHEGEPRDTEQDLKDRETSLSGPHNDMDLKIAVAAPDGEFVSFCGMWYDPRTENALVEPVATVPEYRKMGLGKAAVLEGVIRCGKRGAKRAYVGSSQQFYYNIGFDPIYTETFWAKAD